MRRYSCQVKSSKVRCHKLLRGGLRRNKIGKALSWSKAGNCGSFSTFTMRILTLVGVFSSEKPLLQKTQTFFHIKRDQSLWSLFWREKKRPKKGNTENLFSIALFPSKNRYKQRDLAGKFCNKILTFFDLSSFFFLTSSSEFFCWFFSCWAQRLSLSSGRARRARLECSFVNKQF